MNFSNIKSIRDMDLKDKNVFLRLDLNTPLKNSEVADDTRISAAIPTIKLALEKGAKLVIGSHLGRPKSSEDKQFSLEPVAKRLGELLGFEVLLVEDPLSDAPKGLLRGLNQNQILLLENLRFNPGETKDSAELANAVTDYADIYINDAFGACHRSHASISSLAKAMPEKGIGLLIEKEIQMLGRMVEEPEKPFVTILGGSKVSDKIDIIEKIIDKVDVFLVGGAMAYTFLKAKGVMVGKSRVEEGKLSFARKLMQRAEARKIKFLLPVDHIVADSLAKPSEILTQPHEFIPESKLGLDIGPKTVALFQKEIAAAKTVFWNGPMGVFEDSRFSRGSFELAETMANSDCISIVGGGDSAAAAHQSGFAGKMSHISTGGGASLEFLQNGTLPGLEVMRPPKRSETEVQEELS